MFFCKTIEPKINSGLFRVRKMVKLLALLLLVSVVCGVPQGRLRVPETGRSLKSPSKNSPSDFLKSSVGQTNNEVSLITPFP